MQIQFTDQDIEKLQAYAVDVKQIAHWFYDERFQPRAEIKKGLEQEYGSFWPPHLTIGLHDGRIMGDEKTIQKSVKEAGYNKVMYFKPGSKGLTYILEDDQDDWSILRGWTRRIGYDDGKRDENAAVLQPTKRIAIGETVPVLEVLSFVPILDIVGGSYSNLSPSIREARSVLERQFSLMGVAFENLNDLAVLPEGEILFADPGHARRSDEESGNQRIQDYSAAYREATKDYPDINHLFDYVAEDGTWVQQKYFPFPQNNLQ